MPKYERALRHKNHWQQRVREAIRSLQDYDTALAKERPPERSPLPYMPSDSRQPDAEDHFWRYLVLGQGLEELYGCRAIFIPEDAKLELVELWQHLETPFWGYVHRLLDVREFQIQWLHLEANLPKHDEAPEIQPDDTSKPSAKRRRGRPKIAWDSNEGRKRRALVEKWRQSKGRRTKTEFCEDEGFTPKQFKQACDWYRDNCPAK